MFCPKCGSMNSDDTRFCQKCGAPVAQNTGSPVQGGPQINGRPPQAGVPQGGGYAPLYGGTGLNPGYTPPNSGYMPPNAGYRPPNTGFTPPNQGFGSNTGYIPPNQGYNPGYYPPRKKNTGLIAAIIVLVLVVIMVPVLIILLSGGDKGNISISSPNVSSISPAVTSDAPVSSSPDVPDGGPRDNYTQILGGGQDTITIMIYICGSDLESYSGCATLDIDEMLEAEYGSNVNIILETGGCSSWSTQGIIDGEVQRWAVQDGQLIELQQLGKKAMLSVGELTDFITFSASNYPANRYGLIFWDHGGGPLFGYGADEIYPSTVLYLPDIADALESSGVKFDFVGFDACLMGSIEIAYMLEPYADYMIASEETEPGYGWDYTPWLDALGENTSMDTVALGSMIVDSFIQDNAPGGHVKGEPDCTLSVVALREIPAVYEELCSYMSNAAEALDLDGQEYITISKAVGRTKTFAEGDYDLIDLVDFAKRSNLDGRDTLTAAIQSAVKYSNSTAHSGVSGLSFYFPYTDLSLYQYAKEMFTAIGFGDEIFTFYDTFINIMAGGQSSSTARSLKENFTDEEDAQADYSAFSWYDNSQVQSYTYDSIDYTELEILQDETGGFYLPLTEDDWDLLTEVQQQILMDDGYGYIDLGSDQYFEMDDDGNLLLNYDEDYTWVAIGGQTVCYYAESTTQLDDGTYVFIGYAPAILNGDKYIDIMLEWVGDDPDGFVLGYRYSYDEFDSPFGQGTLGKGYKDFRPGDTVDFICDYYTYSGEYDDQYYFGDTMTIGDTLPAVTYEYIGNFAVLECYMLVDVYQNYSWTQYVEFPAYEE